MALVSALAIGLGGAAGALARYGVGQAVEGRGLDTLVVNVAGSVVLGIVLGLDVSQPALLAVGVGFCGAFTTFSSHAVETVGFAEDGASLTAVAYVVGTLVLAVVGVLVGINLGRLA